MIELEELCFSYPDSPQATLRGLSFSVAKGEVFGLLGPSGCGKSTTQKILMGLLRGFEGKARIFEQPVKGMGRELYERIGVSFELPTLYLRLTALENLKLFASLYDSPTQEPRSLLRMVDLEADANKRVQAFSKGMKMRLNLCCALLHNPELIFLDEPTTGQDPARARLTRELILRLKSEGKTIFLTTHNMAEAAEVCDTVAFLSEGCVALMGAPEELKRRYGQRLLEVTLKDRSVRTFPMDGLSESKEFLSLLHAEEVLAMHTLEASLDDVFIKATQGKAK